MAKTEEKVNMFVDITRRVKEEISKSSNLKAVEKVVLKLTENEVNRRADLLDKGFVVWSNTEKSLKKCTEDLVTHTEVDGVAVQNRSYSDARYKEKSSLKKKLADIEVALMLAFGENQDYNKLDELVKANQGSGKEKNNKTETVVTE